MDTGYRYFEHTADIGIEARGASFAEAFANAARGLVALLVDPSTLRPRETRDVTITSDGLDDLLVMWLNELLFLYDSEGFLPVEYEFSTLGPEGLRARLRGERVDPRHHTLRGGVKAATYHQVSVVENQGFVARVIVDV